MWLVRVLAFEEPRKILGRLAWVCRFFTCTVRRTPCSKQSAVQGRKQDSAAGEQSRTMARMPTQPELEAAVREALSVANVEEMSLKMIRRGLEERFEVSVFQN